MEKRIKLEMESDILSSVYASVWMGAWRSIQGSISETVYSFAKNAIMVPIQDSDTVSDSIIHSIRD